MTTPQERAGTFALYYASAKAQLRERARVREIRATGNHLAAANDEPEPLLPVPAFDERIAAEIRAERRGQP